MEKGCTGQKTNSHVCQALRVASFTTTLRVHRLQFLQSMLSDKANHKLYLSTLYGRYVHDKRNECDRPCNKWIQQYHEDIMYLAEFDEMIWLCEILDDKLEVLVNNEDARDTFCRFDCKQLSAREILQGQHPDIDLGCTSNVRGVLGDSEAFFCEEFLENGKNAVTDVQHTDSLCFTKEE